MSEAYSEGFKARLHGDKLTACPYPMTSQGWRRWVDGWNDQDRHLNERDEALDSIGWFG